MKITTSIGVLFITIILNVALVGTSSAQSPQICDAILEVCYDENPYNEWLFPSMHAAYDVGCQNSHQACMDMGEGEGEANLLGGIAVLNGIKS